MPHARHIQTSFAGGELDPLMWSREDVAMFYNSVRIAENVVPLPGGPARRREGWRFAALQRGPISEVDLSGASITATNGGTTSNLTDGNDTTNLRTGSEATISGATLADPCVITATGHGFSTGDRVVIDGVVGMGAPTGSTATITGATEANPCVITAVAHGFSTGDTVRITGVSGMAELNNLQYTITVIGADSFSLDGIDSSAFTTYSSGGSAEKIEGVSINGFQGAITVIDADTFSLDDFDSSALAAYVSGGTARSGIGNTTEFEVFRIDFGSAQAVDLVDLRGVRLRDLTAAIGTADLTLQSSTDASTWADAAQIEVGNIAYNRRLAAAPDTSLGSARYWRVIVDNPDAVDLGGASAEVSGVLVWTEAGYSADGTVGEFSLHRLTASITREYVLVITAGNCDIFRTDTSAWVAAVSVPHTDAQVRYIKSAPNLDTLILYHQDQPPFVVQRLTNCDNWRSNALVFDTITEFAFDSGTVGGGENEIQFIRFDSMAAGNRLLVEYNGNTSDEVIWTGTPATNAANLEAAIEGLPDITSVSVTVSEGADANAELEVEFTGVDGKQKWPILVIDVLTGSGTAVLSRKQFGRRDFDALWSATRGYPRCGTFYQGRHWMGGFKARPDVLVASRVGALFDFKEDADPVAGSPLVVSPNIDDQTEIQNIYPGRHLQIFTSSAEIYVPDEPITVDNIALKITSRHGATSDVQPVDIQGGTMFIDRTGRNLREYLFTDMEQSYSAEPVSLLAGHLVSSPRSLVLRRGTETDEPTILFIANTGNDRNGDPVPAAMCVIDRAQQVTGFVRINTQGTPIEFATSQAGAAFAMVERELAGETWHYLEKVDDAAMSDCSVQITGSGSTIDLTDFPWLEGQEVEVHVDGKSAGAFTVASNEIDLGDISYSAKAEVGLRQVPRVRMHPLKGRGSTTPTMNRQRLHTMLLQLDQTASVAVTGHDGGTARNAPLSRMDQGVMDRTLDEMLFTGPKRISGLGRWQIEPTAEITQTDPMPWCLRSVTIEVRF
jgi:hypothetical protein